MTNTEEIERLGDIVGKAYCDYGKNADDVRESVANFIAKEILKHYLPSPSVVSPLVWKTLDKPNNHYTFYAETPIGTIYGHKKDGQWIAWLRERFNLVGGKTPEEAQEEAEKAYTTLIGSCLQGGGYTEEQVENAIIKVANDFYYAGRAKEYRDIPNHIAENWSEILTALKQQ